MPPFIYEIIPSCLRLLSRPAGGARPTSCYHSAPVSTPLATTILLTMMLTIAGMGDFLSAPSQSHYLCLARPVTVQQVAVVLQILEQVHLEHFLAAWGEAAAPNSYCLSPNLANLLICCARLRSRTNTTLGYQPARCQVRRTNP